MTAHSEAVPVVMAAPYGDDYSEAFEGRVLTTTPGSYEIFMEKDGKSYEYVGKGDDARMRTSEKRHVKDGYEVTGSQWDPAKDHRDAFKDEDRKMQKYTGDERAKSDTQSNQRNAPGKKYREQDGD